MKNIDEIKEKLIKLINKEESARKLGNLQEAEAFASKVQELLLQYELDIQDLKDKTAESTNIVSMSFDVDPLTAPHESDWVKYLYAACRRANFCDVLFIKKTTRIMIIGTNMNIELLHYMCTQLIVKLRTLARDSFKTYTGPDKRNTYIRSFLKGACAGIKTRLNLDRKYQQENHQNINALVIQKDRAVTEFVQKNFRVGAHEARRPGSTSAFEEGFEKGSRVDIHKGVNNNRGVGGTRLLGN